MVTIAKDLIGKKLISRIDDHLTGGIIVETEAYRGTEDRACHAYGGRRTARTEIMYHGGGVAYIYLCYGIHSLLNVVTNAQGTPHAVLIRALEPTLGIEVMENRRQKTKNLCTGPGALCQALGITRQQNGLSFQSQMLSIEEGIVIENIACGPRIGIDYAGEDAHLPYRFFLASSLVIS